MIEFIVKKPVIAFLIGAVLILATALGYIFFVKWLMVGSVTLQPWEARGLAGDSFGALNAIFSGLAFTGLFIAIMLQREDLRVQQSELKETRKVQEQQKEAQTDQARALLISARLNALNSLYKAVGDDIKDNMLEQTRSNQTMQNFLPQSPPELLEKRNKYLAEIDALNSELKAIKSLGQLDSTKLA